MEILSPFLIVIIINVGTALYINRNTFITVDTTRRNHSHDGSNLDITNSTYRVIVDRWPSSFFDGVDFKTRNSEVEKLAENGRRKRAITCNKRPVISLAVYFDDAFHNRFGSQSVERLNGVLTHMQRVLDFETFSFSLNGELIESPLLDVLEFRYLEGWLYIGWFNNPLYDFAEELYNDWTKPNANHYMLFSSHQDRDGTVGIAWFGSTCAFPKRYRSSIVEYYHSDELTGEIAAHELGHGLGANHDFMDSDGGPRYDSENNTCTGINGIMDYDNYPDKWTQCSNEDMLVHFSPYASNLCFPFECTCAACSCVWHQNNFKKNKTTENKWKWRKCCKRKARQFSVTCCTGCGRWL